MIVLITGVSSGIGRSLAEEYLNRGANVLGMSRRQPEQLLANPHFRFESVDLRDADATGEATRQLLQGVERLDLVVLNAGVLTPFGDMRERTLEELKDAMQINVWANKVVLDQIFATVSRVDQVVAISSGAAVLGNRGWNGYSISKAALNMLIRLYSREQPETHFFALAPGLVDTAMQDYLCSQPVDERFPALEAMQAKRGTDEMPTAQAVAEPLIRSFQRIKSECQTGEFARITQFIDSQPG